MMPEPESDKGTCTVAGEPIEINVYVDEDAVDMVEAQIETMGQAFMVAFGIKEMAIVVAGPDDRVQIGIGELTEDGRPTDEQKAILEDVADELDGDVETITADG